MANDMVRASLRVLTVGILVSGAASQGSAQSLPAAVVADATTETTGRLVTINADRIPLPEMLSMIARQAKLTVAYGNAVGDVRTAVSLHVRDIPVTDALDKVLRGTGLAATISRTGHMLVAREVLAHQTEGEITGMVRESKTGMPIVGATVSLDDAAKGVVTDAKGAFRLAGVAAGTHVVTVRHIGYVRVVRNVSVQDDASVSMNVALEPSVNALTEIVVTGTVIPTERKAIPNALTVITAKEIEQRGITRIDQLFRGDVPGLFAMNQGSGSQVDGVSMFSRGSTSLISLSNNSPTPIKTYVDGVELADARYLSAIDPQSIERIEILTGPQASTIYGSNAINGVMQIFTKRGATAKPLLTATLLSGFVQNNLSDGLTPQHDYSAQLSGNEGRLSYNAGGSWLYMGPWTPAKQLTTLGGFGGVRLVMGPVTGDASVRVNKKTSKLRGSSAAQVTNVRYTNGEYSLQPFYAVDGPYTYSLDSRTIGLNLSYAPVSWWSNEAVIGNDESNYDYIKTKAGYSFTGDTILRVSETRTVRSSLRYATTASVPLSSLVHTTLTLGADGWRNLSQFSLVQGGRTTGTLSGPIPVLIQRTPDHNTGGFFQGQVGFADALFLTYGVRAEWNPNYGDEAQPNIAPRYGAAYTRDLNTPVGPLTTKLRFSYGRATRPPLSNQKAEIVFENSTYGRYVSRMASPDLGPEFQQGGEGGVELYFGGRGSLIVTRYNQTVDGLIGQPSIDSVRAISPNSDGTYQYQSVSQNLNIGSIRNQGWELQGSINTGPLTTKATYAWTKSRVIGLTEAYKDLPQGIAGTYTPGASLGGIPEHTWALNFTYARAETTVGLNLNGTGQIYRFSDDFLMSVFNSRLDQTKVRMSRATSYQALGNSYTMADLNMTHRFSSHIEAVGQVQNLTDVYEDDYGNGYATMGRQTKIGFRVRM